MHRMCEFVTFCLSPREKAILTNVKVETFQTTISEKRNKTLMKISFFKSFQNQKLYLKKNSVKYIAFDRFIKSQVYSLLPTLIKYSYFEIKVIIEILILHLRD